MKKLFFLLIIIFFSASLTAGGKKVDENTIIRVYDQYTKIAIQKINKGNKNWRKEAPNEAARKEGFKDWNEFWKTIYNSPEKDKYMPIVTREDEKAQLATKEAEAKKKGK
ncbi:MAG: hypothetical protein JW982_05040 [Spirochaetes bacterium]|nr:hypothetical protein [Spirochaetota bacterium]